MPVQARTEFAAALNQIASEKGVDTSIVLEAIETAALAAFKKDLSLKGEDLLESEEENYSSKIDPASGEIQIFKDGKDVTPPGFARIAAQTARQVIMQKLYEAEKTAVMDEYEQKVGVVVTGAITRQEGGNYFVDLGRAEGIMPLSEQTRDEYYHMGQRLKVYIKEIREGRRGPEVVVSRSDANLVKGLFAMEVPEIQSGSVTINLIAREAGGRTKVAAVSSQDGVDPVGSLVGQKGVRVQAVMQELGEEKIDIVPFSEDPVRFIASALSPAKDVNVTLTEESGEKVAKVIVPDSQLSLAIGKGGQNVRLAAKLTGYKIDIEGLGDGLVKERGTSENKEDMGESKRVEVVEEVEKNIEEAASQEGAELPEPDDSSSSEEVAQAAAQAEADMEGDKVLEEGSGAGDLIGTDKVDEIGEVVKDDSDTLNQADDQTSEK